jgi:transposase
MGIKRAVEMAKLWDGEISDRTISRALKKIGFTRKKRPTAIPSEMKSSGRLF